ncbi:hypothetical protein [Roseimaritima sediminicola]|uniref:hypothetical protein n=1 Tax=Roseimaritima sediminicola TaxID=2662066 RepID=UPI001387150F|nr:hypothetical protein [Roseimaritima sediminicola]
MKDAFNMKKRFFVALAALCLVSPGLLGCSRGVQERDIQVSTANDPLSEPRSLLQRYAEGQAIGSESMGYPALVANVREVDPERADILEDGLAKLEKASPAQRKAIAAELLQKLQPQMVPSGPADDAADAE